MSIKDYETRNYIAETFYLPKDVEDMDWEEIVKFAIENDYAAMDYPKFSPFGERGFRYA